MTHTKTRLMTLTIGIVLFTTLARAPQLFAETDLIAPPGRAAAPVVVTVGPDHNLWFTEQAGLKIGKITPAGAITEYPIPGAQALTGIAAGPDGNLWFTDEFSGFVGRISTSGTNLKLFPLALNGHHPQGITAGADGNLWFVDEFPGVSAVGSDFKIGRITPAGHITEFSTNVNAGLFSPYTYGTSHITLGPDGNVWFTNPQASGVNRNIVGKITPAGVVTIYNMADTPVAIVAGPDGNLWVTETAHVAKVTTLGVETEYAISSGNIYDTGIAVGPDGNIWISELTQMAYITPSGQLTEFPATNFFPAIWYMTSLVTGPDGALWTVGNVTSNIGRVSTSGELTNTYALNAGSFVSVTTLGPDGAVWSSDYDKGMISRVDVNGHVSNCPVPANSRVIEITKGPDGNLWYVDNGRNVVAKITTSCVVTEYSVGQRFAGLWSIKTGPDGDLWFNEYAARYNAIVKISIDGVMTSYPIPTADAMSLYVTTGPDGNVWFTELAAQQIAKLDPQTGLITEYPVPGSDLQLQAIVTGPDGNLWVMANAGQYSYILKFSTTGVLLARYPAQFETLLEIVVGADGAMWFPEYYPNGVGRITTDGVVSYVPLTSRNALPNSVAVGADEKLYVAETYTGAFGRLSTIGGTGNSIQATHGVVFQGNIATFVDGTPTAQSGDFNALISWGDGNRDYGTVSGPSGGPFTVNGRHTYASPGSYSLQVSLHDNVDNATYQATSSMAQVQ